MTETDMAAAILDAINAQLGAAKAYDIDDVPDDRPERYVAIDLTRRWVPERRASGEVDLPGYFLTTEYHARNVFDIRAMRGHTKAALEDQIIPAAGSDGIGPLSFETAADVDEQDGWFDSADTWTL